MKFVKDDVIGIYGRRGSGKSYLCKKIQPIYPRRVVFDTLGEYADTEFNYIAHSYDELANIIQITLDSRKFKILVKFNIEETKKSEEFSHMIRLLFYRGDICIVIEEMQLYMSSHYIQDWVENLFLLGRHQDISVIYTTQRPNTINKKCSSQATKLYVGLMHDPADIDALKQHLGKEKANEVINLKKREFFYWSENGISAINNDLTPRN